jgi:isopenicillin N synthase-like dioxygenase
VKNHRIAEETIGAVISASKGFFSLPEEEKLKVRAGACCFDGYFNLFVLFGLGVS